MRPVNESAVVSFPCGVSGLTHLFELPGMNVRYTGTGT